MIQLDLSILNQKGTPMFNSDIFANRPNFGIVGRIFISTDTSQIFRDTGTSYVLIASASAGITGSGTPGTLPLWSGSTSLGDSLITQSGTSLFASAKTFVNNTNTGVSLINPLGLSVGTTNTFNGGITWPSLEPCDNVEFLQLNQYGGNITYQIGSYTSNHLILSSFTFLVASRTITSNQTTGIRSLSNQTLQARINGTNNGTITHFANSQVYGDFASSTARFIFTNRYGYLVNDFDEYGAGHTYTNRFAFYNQGAADNNFFNGKVQIGGGTPGAFSFNLDVNGTARVSGVFRQQTTGGNNYFELNANVNNSSPFITAFKSGSVEFKVEFGEPIGAKFFVGSAVCFNNSSSIGVNVKVGNLFATSAIETGGGLLGLASTTNNFIRFQQNGAAERGTIGFATNLSFLQIRTGGATSLSDGILSTIFDNIGSVGIGGITSINASAILQADSTTKGFLPPRMTTVQKNAIATPAAGLLIYDSTLNKLCVRTASAWETVTSV